MELFSIGQVNSLPHEQMVQVYRHLVPIEVLHRWDIKPHTLTDDEGRSLFRCTPGASSASVHPQENTNVVQTIIGIHNDIFLIFYLLFELEPITIIPLTRVTKSEKCTLLIQAVGRDVARDQLLGRQI